MSHKRRLFWTVAALAGFWALEPWAQQDSAMPPPISTLAAPVVVELFTSQSCSSCPPADAVLAELEQHANVIALGCHVTYWDHLDWRDTLGLPLCTERQRQYAAARGTAQVYTPQMVVNGRVEFIGSNRGKAVREIGKAAKSTEALKPIALARKGDTLTVTLPQLEPGARLQTLWLLTIRNKHSQTMRAGENRGRTVAYVNPVAALSALDTWNGQATTRTYPLPPLTVGTKGFVVLAQAPNTAPLTAAGIKWVARTRER